MTCTRFVPDPVVIAVAPNGAYKSQADHPALPITAAELAQTAAGGLEAGASMLHLHVRDRAGRHTLDPEVYQAAIGAIRRQTGDRLLIQATSEAAGIYRPEAQMRAIRELRPEAVSLALREIVPDEASEKEAAAFFAWLARERVLPQFILYSPDDLARYHGLRRRGILPDAPGSVLFVLGRHTDRQLAAPQELLPFLNAWQNASPWMTCAFGARENACALATMALGGHVRVGFENNLQRADGQPAADNAELAARAVAGAKLLGRSVADADAAREILSG